MADKNKRPLGLYLHFPFCVRKCRSCDFLSFPSDEAGREIYLERLKEENIETAVIGYTTDKAERVLMNGGEKRYLDRPAQDELARFLSNQACGTE